jgi:hypothetical protein
MQCLVLAEESAVENFAYTVDYPAPTVLKARPSKVSGIAEDWT